MRLKYFSPCCFKPAILGRFSLLLGLLVFLILGGGDLSFLVAKSQAEVFLAQNQGPGGRPTVLPPSSMDRRTTHTQARMARGELPMADPKEPLPAPTDWRIKIHNCAIAKGDTVLLGEIAEPIGPLGNWVTSLFLN